jgi:hypothetical protein
VTVDIPMDLTVVLGEERRVQCSQIMNAMPPPTTEKVLVSGTR